MLVGVAAWLIGAAAATFGSLYAVGKIGHDLLQQQARQVSIATLNAEYAMQSSGRAAPPARPANYRPGSDSSPKPAPSKHLTPSSPSPKPKPAPSQETEVLVSPGGTAGAVCEAGGAYIVWASPAQGYQIDNLQRGPAAVASVTFERLAGGVMMTVTCQGGSPVEHVSTDT
jgi:hypothetical protein